MIRNYLRLALCTLLFVNGSGQLSPAQEISDNEKIPLVNMQKLHPLLGAWETIHYAFSPDNTWEEIAKSTTVFSNRLKGKLIVEEIKNINPADGFIVETNVSYDQYRNLYRLAAVDDIYGLMDIYEGNLDVNGDLIVTNLRAGTYFPDGNGGKMHFRLSFKKIDNDNREFLVERSSDEGASWIPMNKNILKRTSHE